jgi:hypothetical protein
MILSTMNKKELAREIFSDYEVVERKAGYLMKDVVKIAKKRKLKKYQAVFPYNSLRRNKWTIKVWHNKKHTYFQSFLHFRDKQDFHAVFVDPKEHKLAFHSSHFLQRYNERFLHRSISSKTELMLEFLSRNPIATIADITEEVSKDTKLFAYLNDGIGLGYQKMVSNYTFDYMKTFITEDMIHAGQEHFTCVTSELFDLIMRGEFGNGKIK